MIDSANYVKIVEWSTHDNAFVGQCPGIIGPCCHGLDEVEVYRNLCMIVEDWLAEMQQGGKPMPTPTAGRNVANLLMDVVASGSF